MQRPIKFPSRRGEESPVISHVMSCAASRRGFNERSSAINGTFCLSTAMCQLRLCRRRNDSGPDQGSRRPSTWPSLRFGEDDSNGGHGVSSKVPLRCSCAMQHTLPCRCLNCCHCTPSPSIIKLGQSVIELYRVHGTSQCSTFFCKRAILPSVLACHLRRTIVQGQSSGPAVTLEALHGGNVVVCRHIDTDDFMVGAQRTFLDLKEP